VLKNQTYEKRASQGLCILCGKDIKGEGTKCEACREKERDRCIKLPGIKNPNKLLDAHAKEAYEAGLSYGKWRMKKDMEERGEG
jgi:hypothetical protein